MRPLFRAMAMICLLSALALQGACSQRATLDPTDLPDGRPTAPEAGANVPGSGALPRLADLPQGGKQLSLVGPGWLPLEHGALLLSSGVTLAGGNAINLDGGTGFAYGVYGIHGFDGDNGPTSARVTSDGVGGQYFVGFSDYQAGRWLWAGPYTDSAEVEIPNTGDYVLPTAFISEFKVSYLVLAVSTGDSATLTPELGVHGGTLGPPQPAGFLGKLGDGQLQLTWNPSAGSVSPDFGGYRLERAPGLFGSFTVIYEGAEEFFIDTDVVNGELYRYRVAASDTSGNLSFYVTRDPQAPLPGEQLNPVVIATLPSGPLYGPVDITIDLSASYDPEGGVIDTYSASGFFYGDSGPAPVLNLSLQPGCHVLELRAYVGAREGSRLVLLKVYPRWMEEPVTVAPSGGIMPRLEQPRSGVLPDGTVLHLGYDYAVRCLGLWVVGSGQPKYIPIATLSNSPPSFIGEPLLVGDSMLFPVTISDSIRILSCKASEVNYVTSISLSALSSSYCALVDGPGGPGVVYTNFDAGPNPDLMYMRLDGLMNEQTITPSSVLPLNTLDAVYTPGANAIDIITGHGAGDGMWWQRYRPGDGILDSAQLTTESTHFVDLELDPSTGRPAMVHYHLIPSPAMVRYQSLNADNTTWSAAEQVSDTHVPPGGDLVINSAGTFVFAGKFDGFTNEWGLYRRDGVADWTLRNSSPGLLPVSQTQS